MKKFNFVGLKSSHRTALLLGLAVVAVAVAGPAAAEGLDKVNESVQKVLSVCHGISIGVVTIAIIVAGYKIAFGNSRFMEVVPILGGGLLVAVAAELAAYLIQ
ncbi:TrbC/VirB2 family protein [Xanthomonas fragariae]|uniref:TrbC/VirB2 family protein n=2 Tax=Xanthomonas fragariae TaxID=48664 RepID=UPI000D54F0A3|nr:TrbC/VirB2 family protein [Xanthomonas fragariae]MEA5249891.1 TrbC/VirB2 family protein [Xanthomonas fragariae]